MTEEQKTPAAMELPKPGTPEGQAFEKKLLALVRRAYATVSNKEMEEALPATAGNFLKSLVLGGILTLRRCIESHEKEGVSWEHPWIEARYPAPWDWEKGGPTEWDKDKAFPEPWNWEDKDASEQFAELLASIHKTMLRGEDPLVVNIEGARKYLAAKFVEDSARKNLLHQFVGNVAVLMWENGGMDVLPFKNDALLRELESLTPEERMNRVEEIAVPVPIGVVQAWGETEYEGNLAAKGDKKKPEADGPKSAADKLIEKIKSLQCLNFVETFNGLDLVVSLSVWVNPIILNMDKRESYFPITIGIETAPADPAVKKGLASAWNDSRAPRAFGKLSKEWQKTFDATLPNNWSEEDRAKLWEKVMELPDRLRVAVTLALAPQFVHATIQEFAKGPAALTETVPTASESRPAVLESPEAPPPGIRTSVMSRYPVSRDAEKSAHGISLQRALSKLFGSSAKVPELGLTDETTIREAEGLFWGRLEDYLESSLPGKWSKEKRPDGRISLALSGLQVDGSKRWWDGARRSMNKEAGGPGLDVAEPSFSKENRLEPGGEVVVQTRLVFWPVESFRQKDGEDVPPVRFRSDRSPGYLALLDRQGMAPYFADGWLWTPRGEERDGYRIAGLARLLFPEGRDALERIQKRKKDEYENELQRIVRQPSLFRDEDEKMTRDLRSAISKAEAYIKGLSVYNTRDLTVCIYEAWYRQRDQWIDESVTLEDERIISTRPFRIIRLDPDDLKLRLDPGGKNWRAQLLKRLEALTTFQRITKDKYGHRVDLGEQFLSRVIDGATGEDGDIYPDQDPGIGLRRLLKDAGGIPSSSFYVEVSIEFMARLFTWFKGPGGVVRWGMEAARAAKQAAIKSGRDGHRQAKEEAEEKRASVSSKPYYEEDPKLMSLYNLEQWPQAMKDFAHVLLLEKTNSRRRKTLRRNGETLIPCAGSHGKGYKVKTWIDKFSDRRLRPGPRGGVSALKALLDALRFLSNHETIRLKIELKGPKGKAGKPSEWSKWDGDALAALESYKDSPPAVYPLKLIPYLPEDMEERLRNKLKEVGINAIDEEESVQSVLSPASNSGLSPADIRVARKKAGWEQKDLADKVGVSRVVISQWENAKRPVSKNRAARLLEVLTPYLAKTEKGG